MRVVLRLLVLLPLLWVEGVWGVDCASPDYDLRFQAEVDALGATGCDRVLGDLFVTNMSSITNLDGLANITSVGGDLAIQYTSLVNVDGLISLTSVGGYVLIRYNAALTDLNGLVNLIDVGDVWIASNDSLANCQGAALVLGWPDGPPDDNVGGTITVEDNGIGCDSVGEVLASVSGPTQPVINQATASSNSITLGFTSSTTTDTLFPITGYSASCTGSQADVSGSPATDLLDNTPIHETLNVAGYDPTAVLS